LNGGGDGAPQRRSGWLRRHWNRALAREAGLHPTQLYKWRRQLCTRQLAASGFAPVQIIGEPAAPGLPAPVGVIEIELADGTRLRITGAVDAATVSATVGALVTKERRS
jgi:transposase